MHVKCANELRAEIDRKDRELSIVKDQLRNMPKPKADVNTNNNYYSNRGAKSNMFIKKDQVPSRPGLNNRAQNDKFNIFPKMQSNVAPSAKMYGNTNTYQQARNRYSAAGNNRVSNQATRQNLNSRGGTNQQRLPTWANSNSRNRLGQPVNVSKSIQSNRNSSNNLMKNSSEKRFLGNGIKTSQVSNTDSKKGGISSKNVGYPYSRNRVMNERSLSNPKMLNQDPSAPRQDSSMRNRGNFGNRNNSNGPRLNYNSKGGNLSLSHSRSIENNRNRNIFPKYNSKTPMGYM